MMTEVGVHDDHVVSCRECQAVDVGCAETEFAAARLEDDVVGAVVLLKLFGDFEGAVGTAIVDDDDFPV